ncbi:MAG: hypothetical protein H7A45_20095 [Verrucomicrobiales bacterium]|nr:hypothetical protein [Verrucomicrobiales bacterium]
MNTRWQESSTWFLLLMGAVAIRGRMLGFVSGDMQGDMVPWWECIDDNGCWLALGQDFSNYPPLYLYVLAIATSLPLPRVFSVKLVYVAFDFLVAGFVGGVVQHGVGTERSWWWGALATAWLPTMAANASRWGQCDAMYVSGMVGCVYYLLKGRDVGAMVALGVAFSFKPQAVFLGPCTLVLVLQRRLSLALLSIISAVYLVLATPAWLAGRPLQELVLLYAHQRILPFPALTLGATNIYQWVTASHFETLFPIALGVAVFGAVAFVWFVMRGHGEGRSDQELVRVALLSVVLMPYLLPAMHERYFFPADVLSVAYAFWAARGWIVTVLIQTASFFTYLPYLFNSEPFPRPVLAVVMGGALVLLVRDTWKGQKSAGKTEREGMEAKRC